MQKTYKILRTIEQTYSTSGHLVSSRTFQPITSIKAILDALGESFTSSGHNLKYRRILWLLKNAGLPLHLAIAQAYNEYNKSNKGT
jgi:hypothetical protein